MIKLSALITYPIKACRGHQVDASDVVRAGLKGDRRMMVVTPEGEFLTQRDYPKLALVTPSISGEKLTLTAPDTDSLSLPIRKTGTTVPVNIWRSSGVPAIDQGNEAAEWFSAHLGIAARLVHIADGYMRTIKEKYAVTADDHTAFADGYPILLASEEGLADLNARLDKPVPMDRFRPNVVVKDCDPFAEDTWRRIRIGDVELAIVKPCVRCVVTTIDKRTLRKSKEPLKTLASYRTWEGGAIFGQNVIPLNEGRLELGMTVEVLERR
ncbi:MAG: MOSC domain-containing protein [Anaerolineales bacterium]